MGCLPSKVEKKDVESEETKIEELDHPKHSEMKSIMGEFVEAVPEGVEIEGGCVVIFDGEGRIIASTQPECPWAGKDEWREQFSKFVWAANEFVATDSFNSFPVLGLLTGPSHHLLACYRLGNGGHMVFYACSKKDGEGEEGGDVDVDALNNVGYEFGGKLVELLEGDGDE